MPNSKSPSVITINFQPPVLRWILLLPALLALLAALAAVRWYVGNTVAEYARPLEEGGLDMARVAVRWAPSDPLTHWRLGAFEQKAFGAENLAAAVREFQFAVEASPYDYRYWMELGRALEASGDPSGAEKALQRAVELAPAYSQPRWFYGNLLLRQGKTDEAFVEFARVAQADEAMRPGIFGVALQVFNGEVDPIVSRLQAPAIRLQFAISLANAERYDDALRVLGMVDLAERRAQISTLDGLIKTLIARKQFRVALAFLSEVDAPGSYLPEPERFWNGDFEKPVPVADPQPFHWLVESRQQVQISIYPRGHTGAGSLRLVFKAQNKLDNIPVSQTIIVEPDTPYRLQFYQRTEGLTSASPPLVLISDASDNTALASSQPSPTGNTEWQLTTVDFRTKPAHDAVTISLGRNPCDDKEQICPIFGIVWYDDFNLQRLSSAGAQRRPAGSTR